MTRTFRFDVDGKLKEVGKRKPVEPWFLSPEVPLEAFQFVDIMAQDAEKMLCLPPLDPNSVRGVWGTKG